MPIRLDTDRGVGERHGFWPRLGRILQQHGNQRPEPHVALQIEQPEHLLHGRAPRSMRPAGRGIPGSAGREPRRQGSQGEAAESLPKRSRERLPTAACNRQNRCCASFERGQPSPASCCARQFSRTCRLRSRCRSADRAGGPDSLKLRPRGNRRQASQAGREAALPAGAPSGPSRRRRR